MGNPFVLRILVVYPRFEPVVGEDIWQWREDKDAGFSVKTCYFLLLRQFREHQILDRTTEYVFAKLWK
jgi:hypothetical protein